MLDETEKNQLKMKLLYVKNRSIAPGAFIFLIF